MAHYQREISYFLSFLGTNFFCWSWKNRSRADCRLQETSRSKGIFYFTDSSMSCGIVYWYKIRADGDANFPPSSVETRHGPRFVLSLAPEVSSRNLSDNRRWAKEQNERGDRGQIGFEKLARAGGADKMMACAASTWLSIRTPSYV